MRAACLNPVRQEEDVIETTSQPYPKKRRRLIKGKQQKTNDGEFTNVIINPSSDGEWIKTEIILDEQIPDPFEAECKIREGTAIKLDIVESESNDDDFNAIDPEFDPGDYSQTKIHSCSNCSKTFRKLTELRKHSRSCEHNDQMVKTESSDEQIMDENQLDDDFEIELIDDKKETKVKREYRCDYCPVRAVRKENLKKHMKAEHPDKVDCFVEKRRRRSKIDQDAVNRAKVVVDSRTYYHCDECGKNLHSPYTYIWHNRIHTGERPFVCDLCGKQFRVSQGLVRHLRETHAGIKNFPCDLCGRMFATRRNVEEHRRIHTNERPYICDLCGKAFKQKASLFVHNRSHNDSFPFKCSYCNQGFRTRPPLLVHVTRHTGEKPHACDICGRCFRIKYELKRHRLIHSDDKPFSCTDCGLSFRQKRYLRNHNKINHNRLTP